MSGIKYKTSFQDMWLTDDQYKNFGLKKILTFTQQSAKSAQNHFQLQSKEEKPWTHMLKA